MQGKIYINDSPVATPVAREAQSGSQKHAPAPLILQPQLTVGSPDDPYETEADAVADHIMREPADKPMPPFSISRISIQRQDVDDVPSPDPEYLPAPLLEQPAEPNFLSLRTPFIERNAFHLWDPQSALGVWRYNLDFFKRFGLSESFAGKAANFTAPFFINAQLRANNPTWWEISDRELNTSSVVGSLPFFSFDSNFSNWRPLPFLQPKMAETVFPPRRTENFLQRKCAACEKDEKPDAEPGFLQMKSTAGSIPVSSTIAGQIASSRGSGQPMDGRTESFMASRFSSGLQHVNIHTGSNAAKMNRELNASAFTVGNDIYFNEGKYRPGTDEGKRLLAHELVHTFQQGASTRVQRQSPGTTFPPPHVAASHAVINLINLAQTEHILFDGWNNDCRDNNKNGSTDGSDRAETGSSDGSHFSGTYPGFSIPARERCLGGEGGFVELLHPFTTSQEVKYRVCADVISKAYHDAGVPLSITRRVRELVQFFRSSRHCDFWEFSSFPGPFLLGDFICSYNEREGHGHAGMVVQSCSRGEMPLVIHLPGPSQGIARSRYDPRRTSDLTLERWPIDIRAIYGIGRYHG